MACGGHYAANQRDRCAEKWRLPVSPRWLQSAARERGRAATTVSSSQQPLSAVSNRYLRATLPWTLPRPCHLACLYPAKGCQQGLPGWQGRSQAGGPPDPWHRAGGSRSRAAPRQAARMEEGPAPAPGEPVNVVAAGSEEAGAAKERRLEGSGEVEGEPATVEPSDAPAALLQGGSGRRAHCARATWQWGARRASHPAITEAAFPF